MKILFLSYAAVSLHEGSVRPVAMIRALADAGHRIDLAAPSSQIAEHPNIHLLSGSHDHPVNRRTVRSVAFKAVCREKYDICHAVDEVAFFATYLCRWKKIRLVYDCQQRFTGPVGSGTSVWVRFFPTYYKKAEAALLSRAAVVFSNCSVLTDDLFSMDKKARVIQLEDIPVQPLCVRPEMDKVELLRQFDRRFSAVIVCSILPGPAVGLRNILMAARKVVDAVPDAVFFFKGAPLDQALQMAANLDIIDQCIFLKPTDTELFLAALDVSDAVLLIPQENSRYIHPLVYTLLFVSAPLVTVHDAAYDEVLTDKTSLQVLSSADAIAEGVLHTIQEPLFSLAVAVEGQHRVAEKHTYSSFKHKTRMIYRDLFEKE